MSNNLRGKDRYYTFLLMIFGGDQGVSTFVHVLEAGQGWNGMI
ncbi:hypothetical protein [Lentibacillus sp. JNUCC-1]|nr:hypothetical protein [Lentibacillus sp. JNUCC-1]